MGFFKRHQGRASYDLFSTYSYFLPGLKGMLMLLIMFLLGSLLGNIVIAVLSLCLSSQFAMEYGTVISYPLMFVPPMLYASYQSRKAEFSAWAEEGSTCIPLDSSNFGRLGGWKLAVVASIATIAAAFIAEPINTLLPEMPEFLKQALEQLTEGPLWVAFLSVSVFAPLFEEWLCRGLVLRGLLRKFNPASAIMVSAAFFAILHMNPWQAIPAFLLGLLFGYVYYKTGSLKLTMLMHCVNNTLALITSRIPSLADAETFMDIMSPWAYVCIYIASVLFVAAAIITFKGIPQNRDEQPSI
jgi:membrane protease YdiL (CAAX protease family)